MADSPWVNSFALAQAGCGRPFTSEATCVSTYFGEACGVRGAGVDSSRGPQNNGTSKWAEPWEALTPDSLLTLPEPALPALLIHQQRPHPSWG